MRIRLRTKTGWSDPVVNKDKQKCDIDGAQLWIGPGHQLYCDLVHSPAEISAERVQPATQKPDINIRRGHGRA
jgi:hypothetical protein